MDDEGAAAVAQTRVHLASLVTRAKHLIVKLRREIFNWTSEKMFYAGRENILYDNYRAPGLECSCLRAT